jgi:TetR/AcrR family transcriptional regulator, repressor for neighboring sulfatase
VAVSPKDKAGANQAGPAKRPARKAVASPASTGAPARDRAPAAKAAAAKVAKPAKKATANARQPSTGATRVTGVDSPTRGAAARKRPAKKTKPYGRDAVIESIIGATLSLWATQGPAQLSMRTIAARADVNYGLVHRHFGTKEAVIRAAMGRVVARSLGFIEDADDLAGAVDRVLPRSTGAHSRLIAWSILQYLIDDVMPEEDVFLQRMRELAAADMPDANAKSSVEAGIRAGSQLALLYGWRLFEPYLVRGLGLDNLSHDELNAYIRKDMMTLLGA